MSDKMALDQKPKCDVCGEPAIGLRCSSTGAISFLYCAKCLEEDREPRKSREAENEGEQQRRPQPPPLPPPLAVHPKRDQEDSYVLRSGWRREEADGPRLCWCIPDQTKLNEGCQQLAVYQIWYGYEPGPEDYSESCGEHLEQLLDDNIRFEIKRLPEEALEASSGSCCIRCHTPLISTYDEGLLVGQVCPTCYPPEQHSPTEENRQRRSRWRSRWKSRKRPKWRSR